MGVPVACSTYAQIRRIVDSVGLARFWFGLSENIRESRAGDRPAPRAMSAMETVLRSGTWTHPFPLHAIHVAVVATGSAWVVASVLGVASVEVIIVIIVNGITMRKIPIDWQSKTELA
jgi:hypothetical protein